MTDHEEFEKWWLTKFSAEFLDSDNCWSAWTGWQARGELDAVKIKELEVENHALGLIIDNEDKELADKVAELTAKIKELESFNKHLGLLNKENLTFICKQKTEIAELTARIEKDREYALSIKKNLERLWEIEKSQELDK